MVRKDSVRNQTLAWPCRLSLFPRCSSQHRIRALLCYPEQFLEVVRLVGIIGGTLVSANNSALLTRMNDNPTLCRRSLNRDRSHESSAVSRPITRHRPVNMLRTQALRAVVPLPATRQGLHRCSAVCANERVVPSVVGVLALLHSGPHSARHCDSLSPTAIRADTVLDT